MIYVPVSYDPRMLNKHNMLNTLNMPKMLKTNTPELLDETEKTTVANVAIVANMDEIDYLTLLAELEHR